MAALPGNSDDARIVSDLEAVYQLIEQAAAVDGTPERSGILNSLRLMLQPSLRAAKLLSDDAVSRAAHGPRETA